MGRRALRRIHPSIDFASHLRTIEQLPRPWDDAALFAELQPLEIEVGSGKGLFLSSAASASPQRNFLGIEQAAKYARFSAARLAQREISNALMIHGDARRVFGEFLPAEHAAAVHVYFPDPWWKARHRRRRIMSPEFLAEVARVLRADGTLHFWTDVEEYYHASLEVLAGIAAFTPPRPVSESMASHDLDYRTHFERRMRLRGLPVYRAEFGKRSGT